MTNFFNSQTPKLNAKLVPLRSNERGGELISASKGTSWATVYALAEQACLAGHEVLRRNLSEHSDGMLLYRASYSMLKDAMSQFDGFTDSDLLDRLCLNLMKGTWANLQGVPMIKPAVRLVGKSKPWSFKKAK